VDPYYRDIYYRD
jgi:hypothetical protein